MSARDNELKVNSEQSLYGYLREFAKARECYNFVGTVADNVPSDESAACSRSSSSSEETVCSVIAALRVPSDIPWDKRVLKQDASQIMPTDIPRIGKCAQTWKAN